MERNYQAREWLGFIIGSKLFFEFTDKYPFESKMSGLIKEVLSRQRKAIPEKPVISQAAPASTEVSLNFIFSPVFRNQYRNSHDLRWHMNFIQLAVFSILLPILRDRNTRKEINSNVEKFTGM